MDGGAWWATVHGITKSRTRLSDFTAYLDFPGGSDGKASVWNVGDLGLSPGLEDPLEKEMASHSSTRAWKFPWTEGPGRLQSMGSQRVVTTYLDTAKLLM